MSTYTSLHNVRSVRIHKPETVEDMETVYVRMEFDDGHHDNSVTLFFDDQDGLDSFKEEVRNFVRILDGDEPLINSMETAPRDGAVIRLHFSDGSIRKGSWRLYYDNGVWWSDADGAPFAGQPIKWSKAND